MVYIYPAEFTPCEEGGYTVTFPDLPGAITEGDTLKEALYMAQDCLGGFLWSMEKDNDPIPKPTDITHFTASADGVFFTLVNIDLAEYKRIHSEKPVRKSLYIPKGLNEKAEAQGINFSQVLRDALSRAIVQ